MEELQKKPIEQEQEIDLIKVVEQLTPVLSPAIASLIDEGRKTEQMRIDEGRKTEQMRRYHSKTLAILLVVFLLIIIGVMGWLTFNGKVSGDALLFLIGTVVGYVINMIQALVFR